MGNRFLQRKNKPQNRLVECRSLRSLWNGKNHSRKIGNKKKEQINEYPNDIYLSILLFIE